MSDKIYTCNCEDFKSNIPIINDLFVFSAIHGGEVKVKFFVYCPYCGQKLKEEQA